MMLPNIILPLFLMPISFLSISTLPSASAQIPIACNRSYHGRPVPYPFGFSDGRDVPLHCAADGIKVRDLPVLNITSDSLFLDLPVDCHRRVAAASWLFGRNYTPTWHNHLMVQNCSLNVTGCSISTSLLEDRRIEKQNCGTMADGDLRCSSLGRSDGFWELEELNSIGCEVLFSSMMIGSGSQVGSVEMELEKVELGWWVEGSCAMNGSCSTHANCTEVVSPVRRR